MMIRLLLLFNLLLINLNCSAEIPYPGAGSQSVTTIYSTVFVTNIDEVDSANQSFVANVYVEFRWHDSRLASDDTLGTVTIDKAWNPRIQIVNQQHLFTVLTQIR